jgi:hypothetical protein
LPINFTIVNFIYRQIFILFTAKNMVTQLSTQYVDVLTFYIQYSVYLYKYNFKMHILSILKVKNQGRPGPTGLPARHASVRTTYIARIHSRRKLFPKTHVIQMSLLYRVLWENLNITKHYRRTISYLFWLQMMTTKQIPSYPAKN